jgi:hypothetical protein
VTANDLHDQVCMLLDSTEQASAPGAVVWAFFTKEQNTSLDDVDEIVRRIERGLGVFLVEMVLDDDLELVQRSSEKIKQPADLAALKRTRIGPLTALPPRAEGVALTAPAFGAAPKRRTIAHGALLDVPTGDKKASKR